jgi:nitrite reductase/ring-hydroxylating ferredoxin subunit
MAPDSKIRFFLIPMTLVIILSSCNKKNDVIPDIYVNFDINLNDVQFHDLSVFGGSIVVDSHTNNLGYRAAGYDGNGIIICSGVEEFYAYDSTCPHDYVVNSLSIKVNIDPSNSTLAICPKCGTKYALTVGGTPASGVGRYPLKNYRTRLYENTLSVWN